MRSEKCEVGKIRRGKEGEGWLASRVNWDKFNVNDSAATCIHDKVEYENDYDLLAGNI